MQTTFIPNSLARWVHMSCWFWAIYLLSNDRRGISAAQLYQNNLVLVIPQPACISTSTITYDELVT